MKTLKNFDNGRLSVKVTKIEQSEEIISERPLRPDEDFGTFHPNVENVHTNTQLFDNSQKTPFEQSYTKNVGIFNISVSRKLR
jgi:hypothetical protein